jgi:hypothetical protein
MKLRRILAATFAVAFSQTAAYGQMNHQHAAEAACDEPALRCASKVTPAFAPDGTLWLAWMAGGQVSVAHSKDRGQSFSTPVAVTKARLNLDWGPDARPKIVVDRDGRISLAFAIFKDKAFNGQVLFSRSTDGGKSFAEPQPITASNESQRFEAVALDSDGSVFAAWLDSATACPRSKAARNMTVLPCSSRHRETEAQRILGRTWPRTTPASAAVWASPLPEPGARSSSSGTSSTAASGITR